METAKNVFSGIQVARPTSSTFDMSYDHKTSGKMGTLIPVNLMEILPGDKINVSTEAMFRLMPMLSPIMHKVDITVHHFFVPNRLVWKGWETYITGGKDGSTQPQFPVLSTTAPLQLDCVPSSLPQYLGLPIPNNGAGFFQNDGDFNALPFAAYQRIYFDWYRDQNLSKINGAIPEPDAFNYLQDGAQTAGQMVELTSLKYRAWGHDYFTACLPFAQKGQAVDMPMEIHGKSEIYWNKDGDIQHFRQPVSGNANAAGPLSGLFNLGGDRFLADSALQYAQLDPNTSMYVDNDQSVIDGNYAGLTLSGTINDLRSAMKLQQWLELNARAGSRYIEHIKAHFDVRSSDYRLQRSQYLGGSKCSMAISEVLQTSATISPDTPQGNMAGHGISVTDGREVFQTFEEHGHFISILSIIPRTAYYQGIPKLFRKTDDRFKFMYPQFATLGEVPVLKEELFYNATAGQKTQNQDEFGYLPIYSEYRYNASRVSGQMADTLDYWHLARKWDSSTFAPGVFNPTLEQAFIECYPDKRIFADTDPADDEIVAHLYHRIYANRKLPFYGTPGGI